MTSSAVDGLASSAALSALRSADQPVHAVERDPAVVADDPPAAVGVGQAGDDVRRGGRPHLGRVGVEDPVVVRLAVPGEDLADGRVEAVPVRAQPVLHHAQAAVGHDRAAQRRVGLQPDDQLVLPVDVAGRVRGDRGGGGGVDVVDAAAPLLGEHRGQPRPQGWCARSGRPGTPRPRRRGEVGLDEVPDVDPLRQRPPAKPCHGPAGMVLSTAVSVVVLTISSSPHRLPRRTYFALDKNL